MAGEIEELIEAVNKEDGNPELAREAFIKLFIWPWPILSIEAQAEKAARRAKYLEDEKLYIEMEKAEQAWFDACDGGDEKTIAAAEKNMDKVFHASKFFGPNTRHEGE